MKVNFIFKWFDFWVGLFYDIDKRKLYFLPIPMIGIVITFPEKKEYCKYCKSNPCKRAGLSIYEEDSEE